MKTHKTYTVFYRRKREGKTDYKKRLRLLLSNKPRLVVRKSLRDISAQIIEYDSKGDKIMVSAKASSLKELGWNFNYRNLPSAYLLGLLIAKKGKERGISAAILDIGLNKSVPGSRLYTVVKGALDNGLKISCSESVLPNEHRLSGKHIEDYAKKLKENQEAYNKKFGNYIKKNMDPLNIAGIFNDIKNKIIGN